MKIIERIKSKRFALVLVAVFVLQAVLGGLVIYHASIRHNVSQLDETTRRVQAGITFNGDSWDVSKYNADSEIPGPHRLYVFANDGFVVDRWRPIAGYLNVSNFRHLLEYRTPRTVETITNQQWRVYSQPVTDDKGIEVGVITASYYAPEQSEDDIDAIDARLERTLNAVSSKLTVEDGEINADGIDTREISFYTPFQVVNHYNRILAKSNTVNNVDSTPDYIDSTYVLRNMNRSSARQVQDDATGERFLTVAQPLTDNDGTQRGIVIVGKSIGYVFHLLRVYIIVNVVLAAVLLLVWLVLRLRFGKQHPLIPTVAATQPAAQRLTMKDIKTISFNKKSCELIINEHKIPLTYATNQYYLCAALFSARKKQWETDELIERFGEDHDHTSWRKIYDASVSVNKKAAAIMEPKLIINNNKTYQINPKLQDITE